MIKLLILFTFICSSNALVYNLTNETIGSVLNATTFVLVNFIHNECDECKNSSLIMEEFGKEEHGIYIAEMNCSTYQCDVQKFPTLRFFNRGVPSEYTGKIKSANIEKFLGDEINSKWFDVHLQTGDDLESFVLSDDEPKVITNIKMPESKLYIPSLDYGYSNNSLFPNNTLRIYTHVEHLINYIEYDENKLTNKFDFIMSNTIKPWNFIGDPALTRAFMYSDEHILLFDNNNKTKEKLNMAARQFSPNYVFVFVTPNNTELITMFNITTYPSLMLVTKNKNNRIHRYPLHGDIDNNSVRKHIKDYVMKKLKPMVISEPTPIPDDSNALRVTGNTIEHVTKKHNLFLMAYAPNCKTCKKGKMIMDALHSKFKGTGLKVGTYNTGLNDNYLVSTGDEVSFLLFTKKHEIPIKFNGDMAEDTFIRFLDEYSFSVHSEL